MGHTALFHIIIRPTLKKEEVPLPGPTAAACETALSSLHTTNATPRPNMTSEDDIETQRGRREKQTEVLDDTEYRPINWKRFFFAPKYLRTSLVAQGRSGADKPLN